MAANNPPINPVVSDSPTLRLPDRKRDRALDIAKGIGITLIVLGHALFGVQGAFGADRVLTALLIVIYSFHVALFFFIAGALSGSAARESSDRFLVRMLRNVVHPYFLWSFVLVAAHYVMSDYTNKRVEHFDPLTFFYEPPAVMWFLYVLLFAYVALRLTASFPPRTRLVIAVVLCVAGYFLDVWLWGYLRFVGLFLLTAQLGVPRKPLVCSRQLIAASCLVMLATAWGAWIQADQRMEGYPAYSLGYLPAAFAGSHLILFVATKFSEATVSTSIRLAISGALSYIGQRSMAIFVVHILVTAGVRIALMHLKITQPWVLCTAATVLGVLLPLSMATAAERFGVGKWLGWPAARRAIKRQTNLQQ